MKPIAFYPELSRKLGSINAAIYYQQLYYWSNKGSRKDGFIYKTAKEMEEETTLSEKQQRLARKLLIELGWIEAKKLMAGGSSTWHFKPLVDIKVSFSHDRPTGETPVPTSKKASSITESTQDISKDISVASQREQIPYRGVLAASTKVVGRSKNKSKPEINYLVEYLRTTMKLDRLDASEVNNRRACSNLLRKFSPLQVKEMIDNASQSPFWSDKVRNFQTLFNNATKILDEKPKKESTLQVLEKFKPYEKS